MKVLKMADKRFNNDASVPLCKFGPGGDFVSDWPPDVSAGFQETGGVLGRTLGVIADVIGAVVSPELFTELTGCVNAEIKEFEVLAREKLADGIDKQKSADNTASVRSACGNFRIRGQAMLFADDCRTSERAKRKPHHRVRTHRRVARKKAVDGFKGTGTLFEAYGKSTTAA